MPIAAPNPFAPEPPPRKPSTTIEPDPFQHSLKDARVDPLSSMLTYIAGSSWCVDYYSQVLGHQEELKPYEPTSQSPYQQYTLIKDYDLKLQGSLSIGEESDVNIMSATGTARLYPYLIPNIGDAFIAQMGNSRLGQFTVTDARKMTLLEETCYEIDFDLARYVTEDVIQNIDGKVVKTVYFTKDYTIFGQNPLLTTDQYHANKEGKELIHDILGDWMKEFYSRECRTLLVGGQALPTYDPYMVRVLHSLFEQTDHQVMHFIRELNCNEINPYSHATIWDVLIERDVRNLSKCFKEVRCSPETVFHPYPYMDGVRYSGVKRVVRPLEKGYNVDDKLNLNQQGFQSAAPMFVPPFLDNPTPLIGQESSYVLSKAFYQQQFTGLSEFEILVKDYIYEPTIAFDRVFEQVRDYKLLSSVQRFYRGMIYVMLIRASLRSY